MNFGGKIKALRIEKKWTQEFVANKLNISVPALSRYEAGTYEPKDLSMVSEFAKLYGVSTDYLLGLSDIRNPVVDAYTDALERQIIRNAGKEELVIGLSRENKGILTDEDKEEITKFAEYVASRRKGGN